VAQRFIAAITKAVSTPALAAEAPQILGGAAIHRCDHQNSPKAGFSRRGANSFVSYALPVSTHLYRRFRDDDVFRAEH